MPRYVIGSRVEKVAVVSIVAIFSEGEASRVPADSGGRDVYVCECVVKRERNCCGEQSMIQLRLGIISPSPSLTTIINSLLYLRFLLFVRVYFPLGS